MQTKSEISRWFILLHLLGLVLLVSAFFLLIPPHLRTHSAWLDLAVLAFVLSINFPPLALVRLTLGDFNVKIAALGLLEVCDVVYTSLAFGTILYGIFYFLPFRLQLVIQVGLLIAAATTVAIAWWAAAHVAEVTEEQRVTRSGLEELKAALQRCETELATKAPTRNREKQLLLALKEDARYLAPTRDSSAISYEQQIVASVDDIRLRIGETASPLTSSPLVDELERCASLMALRKQIVVR